MLKPGCLEIDKTNVASLRNVKPPKNTTQLRSVLVLCNAYWQFIEDLTGIGHALNKLLKKGTPDGFELEDEQKAAVKKFIDKVCSSLVLDLSKANLR